MYYRKKDGFSKREDDPIHLVSVSPPPAAHIRIRDQKVCRYDCMKRPCTYYCPTQVFSWKPAGSSGDRKKRKKAEGLRVKRGSIRRGGRIMVDYERCIECLACPFGCPHENIDWEYPEGGAGVDYQYS